ncbi:hypothetical protein ACFQJD_05550 [Haloplanus sp. GCM10025708]|uniref:DUF7544 domain-containing protein n=1 Tax=Haloferacaceae TaxID=1644056 RepID=UPI0036095556
MSWIAFEALSDARQATEDLLLPIDRGTWLRLAVLAFFLGGGGGAPAQGGGTSGTTPGDVPAEELPQVPAVESLLLVVVAVALLAVAVVVAWMFVGAVMEFVLVTGLRDREIHLRRPFRANLGRGLWLFGFRLALGLVGLALVAVPLLAIFGLGFGVTPAAFLLVLPAVAVFGLVALVFGVINRLTTDFVVPAMLVEDRGILDGWRRVWPLVRSEWKEVGLYVLLRFALAMGAGFAVGIATLLVGLVVAIPFALVGGAVYLGLSALGGPGLAGWVVLGLLGVLFLLSVLVASLVLQVPVLAYLRYYALSALGRIDATLDLVGVETSSADGDAEGGAA